MIMIIINVATKNWSYMPHITGLVPVLQKCKETGGGQLWDKDKPIKMEMPFWEFKSVPKCKQRLGQKISPPTEMASAPQSWWRGSDKGQRGDNGVIGLLIIGLQLTQRDPNENDSTILFVQHERIGSLLGFGYLASSSQYHYHHNFNKIFASINIDYLVTTFL